MMTMVPEKRREETLLSLSRSSRLFDDDNARVLTKEVETMMCLIYSLLCVGETNDICVADPERRKHFDATDAHTRRKRENEAKKRGTTHFLFSIVIPEMSSKDDDDVYPFHGFDSSNDRIGPCDAFWERALKKRAEEKKLWYHQGIEYWSTVDATVDGVLGGFGSVSKADGKENEQILRTMVYPEFDFGVADGANGCTNKIEKRALDVGAGVGRVSVREMNVRFHFVSRSVSFFFYTDLYIRAARQTEHVLDEVLCFGRFVGTCATFYRESKGDVEG